MSTEKPRYDRRAEEGPAPLYLDGVILFDSRLRILAFDEGAAIILQDPLHANHGTDWTRRVPQEILNVLKQGHTSSRPRKVRLQLPSGGYVCRVHAARSCFDSMPGILTVLHLARELSMDEAISLISSEYRLTGREREAVHGVVSGLSSKEVAEQMRISPNTVKAFLRLAMGRMGVSSRTGIIAKLFEPNEHE